MSTYTCFTRTWWRYEKGSTGQREKVPHLGRRKKLRTFDNAHSAIEFCDKYNTSNNPGPLERKCEYTSDY